MSQLPDDQLLCGRFRRRAPELGHCAPPLLRPFDTLLPVKDEISGRDAWLLPFNVAFVGSEIDRSYFMMGASQTVQLQADKAIVPAFVDRDERWFWIGYWADDLHDHGPATDQGELEIVQWALGVAENLDELHMLGKQHGLLSTEAVVRNAQGQVRVWGGGLYELMNKVRLAVKAKQDKTQRDGLFVPALLEGAPLTLQDELAGWAMTVTSRWFNASGAKALDRLTSFEPGDGWACDLKRLLTVCLDDPLGQGICSARDLMTRLEVILDAAKGPGLLNQRKMQAYVPNAGPMPSLESIEVSAHDPRYSTIVPSRPVTSANGGPAIRRGSRPSTARSVSGIDPATWNPPAPSRVERKKTRPWLWASGVILMLGLGGGAVAWHQGLFSGEASETVAQADEASSDSASGQGESAAAPLAAGSGACPEQAARLPGGTCMDRFEYPGQGQVPRVSLTKNQAELLCEARQGRLCDPEEWLSACSLGQPNLEGCQLRQARKNRTQLRRATKSDCVHAGEFYDLLGNAAEWVSDGSARGGDAKTLRTKVGCDARVSGKKSKNSGFSVGFRCCYGPVPKLEPSGHDPEREPRP